LLVAVGYQQCDERIYEGRFSAAVVSGQKCRATIGCDAMNTPVKRPPVIDLNFLQAKASRALSASKLSQPFCMGLQLLLYLLKHLHRNFCPQDATDFVHRIYSAFGLPEKS